MDLKIIEHQQKRIPNQTWEDFIDLADVVELFIRYSENDT